MILFFNPRATRAKNRRYPLSILALAAMIEGREEYAIVDGNIDDDPCAAMEQIMRGRHARMLAVTVMPGPQMVAAIPVCRWFRQTYPDVPIVWGGYFPSLYPDAALKAKYVDFVVRGQGEETFVELLEALNGRKFAGIRGLSYKDDFGLHVHNAERPLRSPGDFPVMPYHALDPAKYLLPSFLGSRTVVHQASIGCPYQCNFCGVVGFSGSREKMESPERTAEVLGRLHREYGANAVQFYDNNFFVREDHARELAERLTPLKMNWWCEARVDAVLRYSDDTLRKIRESGCVMIFFGVESGSNAKLAEMKKQITAEQSLELAARMRQAGIVPEYSLIFGDPRDSEKDFDDTVAFAKKVKRINPDVEIIVQTYVPVPQRTGEMYGQLGNFEFPTTVEEWATERWFRFAMRKDPELSWLTPELRRKIRGFETVMNARWPTVQDWRLPPLARLMLKGMGSWRYAMDAFENPVELRWAQKMVRLREPRLESL
jgi:anaerobic magnesium-protoporphyrin IX monomethyl ester cyclase